MRSAHLNSVLARLTEWLRRVGINRAVWFNILSQGWSALIVPVTMVVITYRLSMAEQGYYYTFASIVALQVVAELGLATVIVQCASHEWAAENERSGVARSRLASLLRQALRWYVGAGVLVMIGLVLGGHHFLATQGSLGVEWEKPWFVLSIVAGLSMIQLPVIAVIEGCQKVISVYRFRFFQSAISSAALLAALWLGWSLYALAVASLVRSVFAWGFITYEHGELVRDLLRRKTREQISWWTDVWPFQWRIGVSALSGYLIFWLFTPVMYYFHGPQVAGRTGMTLTVLAVIEATSAAWITTRVAEFGRLVAQRKYVELDALFRRLFLIAVIVAGGLSMAVVCLIYGLQQVDFPLAARLLPLVPILLFAAQRAPNVAITAMAFYLRSHKREPMMAISVSTAVLVSLSTLILGKLYGPLGAAAGFLAITLGWTLPATIRIFRQCRNQWHLAQ